MNTIFRYLSQVASLIAIVTAIVYFKFGATWAAVAFVTMFTLKLSSSTFNFTINSVENLIRKIPLLGSKIGNLIDLQSKPDLLDAHFKQFFASTEDPLLRGDLEAYAKVRWPEAKHPELWTNIPQDIRRPVINDGRLPDGSAPADTFCATALDNKFIADSFKRSFLTALIVFVVTFIAWRPDMYFAAPILNGHQLVSAVSKENGQQNKQSLRADAWSAEDRVQLTGETESVDRKASAARSIFLKWVLASHGTLTAFTLAFLVFMITWRADALTAVNRRGRRVSLIGAKEGITRWKRRLEKREIEHTAYLGQLATINDFDKTPTIKFGKATGLTKFRGLLTAPEKGENIVMSLLDLSQNTLVIGGTGEGKTRAVLRPVVAQFIDLMKNGTKIGIYGTDGKAVLWKDIKEAAEAAGMGDKVVVIGCEEGEYGVDICDGMEPALIGDTITSVLAQSSGNAAANDFWSDMGSQLLKNAATVARAWEATDAGTAIVAETGDRLFSLSTIYKLCTDQKLAVQAVIDIRSSNPENNPFGTQDLFDALTYMTETWPAITEVTASGIRANVMNALGGFTFNVKLRRQFSSGAADHVVRLQDCWDKIVLVRISDDHGMSARLINIMLKIKLFAAARQREIDNKKLSVKKVSEIAVKMLQSVFLSAERKQELLEVIDLNDRLLFVADEYQDLITSAANSSSDATFWNKSRSTGTIGLIATQSISTLEQAIGKAATVNFVSQMRSLIALRIEDAPTSDYIKYLSGKTFRWNVPKHDQFETWEAYKRELGPEKSAFKPVDLVTLPKMGLLEKAFATTIDTDFGFNPGFEIDDRFFGKVSTSTSGGQNGGISTSNDAGEVERAVWRRDDKVDAYMSSMEEHDGIDDDDLISMGRGQAYVYIQRGGAARQDIIELPSM